MSLGDCIYVNKNIYVDQTSITSIERFTMHFSYTGWIAQHLYPTTEFRKILTDNTKIFEQQNSRQILQTSEVLHIRNKNPNPNNINLKCSANVVKYLLLLLLLLNKI